MAIGQIKLLQGLEVNLPVSGAINELYFTESGKIFKGTGSSLIEYSKDVITTTDLALIISPEQGKMYIDTTNWTVNAWNGTIWKVLGGSFTSTSTDALENKTIDATKNTITNLGTNNFGTGVVSTVIPSTGAVDTKLVTEKAVADLALALGTKIDGDIKNVSYDSVLQSWTFTKQDNTTIVISNILNALIKGVAYNPLTKKLTFTFDGDPSPAPVEIDISDLIDVYTVSDTDSVDLTMSSNNITADIKLSSTNGNLLSVEVGKGLFATLDWEIF